MPRAGEGVEELELWCPAGGNTELYSRLEKLFGSFFFPSLFWDIIDA